MIDKADTYCGKCIKADVCGMEGVYDPATTYCAYRVTDRPHGEWKFLGENLFGCTHCGYVANADYLRDWKSYTYDAEFPTACPKCGASMVKKEGETE